MSQKKVKEPVSKGRAKVPVVMQMEALECGAASLAMVMAYYDKWVPLEQVRLDCGVSRDGSNAKNVLIAARSYGFEAQGYRCEIDSLKDSMQYPCIIHWNFNHFVVLDGFQGNYAWINDPARGEVKVPMEEFGRSFTGICLQIKPGPDFEPGGKPKSTLAFARNRLRGAGAAVAFVLFSTVIGYLFGIINPLFSRFFMDRLLTGENRELLMPFLVLLALMGGAQVITSWVQAVYNMKLNGKMAIVGSSDYMWKILKLPMEFFSQRMGGDILQEIYDRKMLRAYIFALAAGDAVFRPAPLLSKKIIVCIINCPALFLKILPHIFIVQGEIFGNGDVHGTSFGAVVAGGTGDRNLAVDDIRYPVTDLLFLFRQRPEVCHEAYIVLHLF